MQKKLNLAQIFVASKAFLGKFFFEKFSDGLDIIHSGFSINKCKKNWQQEPETWDPSVWIDWMKASSEVLKPEIADPAHTLVDELQGYRIMKKYIQNFAFEFEFQDLIELFHKLNIDTSSDFFKTKIWKDWILCIDATLESTLTLNGSLISLESMVSKNQAFEIMIQFLNDYYVTTIEQTAIDLLLKKLKMHDENSLIYQDWLAAYNQFHNEQNFDGTITVIQAFNAMRLFLEKYKNKLKDEKLDVFLKLLEVDAEQIPIEYQTLWNWLHVTYIVLFQ